MSWRGFANLRTYGTPLQNDLRGLEQYLANLEAQLAKLDPHSVISNPTSGGGSGTGSSTASVPQSRQIIAGTGLTGGGDLSADRTLSVIAQSWPVGSIHISLVSTDPSTTIGYGTWALIGTGRVLVGIDSGDSDYDTARKTSGNKARTPSGTISQPTFTGDWVSLDHSHGAGSLATYGPSSTVLKGGTAGAVAAADHTHDSLQGETDIVTGGLAFTPTGTVSQPTLTGSSMNVCQPSLAVYMWERVS
jgi:hypothetical protein